MRLSWIIHTCSCGLPYACLATKIPDLEFEVFVCDLFHIETNGWNCCDDFPDLQSTSKVNKVVTWTDAATQADAIPVENGGFPCTIKPQDQNPHFPAPDETTKVAKQTTYAQRFSHFEWQVKEKWMTTGFKIVHTHDKALCKDEPSYKLKVQREISTKMMTVSCMTDHTTNNAARFLADVGKLSYCLAPD